MVEEEEEEEGGIQGREVDVDGAYVCPLTKIGKHMCLFSGNILELSRHVRNAHNDILLTGCTFQCTSVITTVFLILFDSELFLYYKQINDGNWHVILQQVGLTNKKYRYKIRLHSEDETVPDHLYTYRMTNVEEEFSTIFDARRCLVSTDDRLEPFITNDRIDMTITITESQHRT
jgi:hypothetical protein